MKKLKPHPKLVKLHKISTSKQDVIVVSGFIGDTNDGLVKLHPTVSLDEYIEIDEKAIIDVEEDETTGQTELFIKLNSTVTVVNRNKVPLLAMAAKPGGSPGGGGTGESCLEKRLKKCKEDPLMKNCDEIKDTLQLLCDLFGDPKIAKTLKMI